MALLVVAGVLFAALVCLAIVATQNAHTINADAPIEGSMAPGPTRLLVRAVPESEGGEFATLGESMESGEKPSGAPRLDAYDVVLETNAGALVRVAKGTTLNVIKLVGARRTLLETRTTNDGVSQRYTFEVPKGVQFWIEGTLPTERPDGPVPLGFLNGECKVSQIRLPPTSSGVVGGFFSGMLAFLVIGAPFWVSEIVSVGWMFVIWLAACVVGVAVAMPKR
jgi:hypothetical protein